MLWVLALLRRDVLDTTLVVFSGTPVSSTNKLNWPPRYNWNVVESGIKHHNSNLFSYTFTRDAALFTDVYISRKYRYIPILSINLKTKFVFHIHLHFFLAVSWTHILSIQAFKKTHLELFIYCNINTHFSLYVYMQ